MLVGEIRDAETAAIGVKAAITGHLVLSTLHTNDAATTISRLGNMGVPPYMIAAAVRLIIAQRLVRTLCARCKAPAVPTEREVPVLTGEELGRLKTIFKPVGCPECNNTGFKGRRPILEVLPVRSPAMRELIANGATPDTIQNLARAEGLLTLRDGALRVVEDGETSLAEALKVFVSD
jgi:type IV pilus assembly protein PilB